MYSPRWLFLYPGILLVLLGYLGYGLAMPGMTISGITFDAHTLLFASLAVLLGYQSILFGIFARTYAVREGLLPESVRLKRFYELVNLERGLVVGAAALIIGFILLLAALQQWRATDFGELNYAHTMRWVIPGVTLTALGFQTVLASFLAGILGLRHR